ncbi:MAG: helicase SNF2 [Acidobacteria bacterium]|nr:MAG: helicase SNF2 [Acidobacteriota bacterium]
MSLKGKFSHEFNPKIRDRGVAYFRSNSVTILDHSDTRIEARVKGKINYHVRLELSSNLFKVACTCPYFEGGEECKHIWSTMLAADSRNYLSAIDQVVPVKLSYDDDSAEELRRLEEQKPENKPKPEWQQKLSVITNSVKSERVNVRDQWPEGREIYYILDPQYSRSSQSLGVEIGFRERKKNGEWGKIKSAKIQRGQIALLPDDEDRRLVSILSGSREGYWSSFGYGNFDIPNRFIVSSALQHFVLPMMCATRRCVIRPADRNADYKRIEWDDLTSWQFWLVVKRSEEDYELDAVLRDATREIAFESALLTTEAIVIAPDYRAARFDSTGAKTWIDALGASGDLRVPAAHSRELIAQLVDLPSIPNLDLPEELHFERVRGVPRPQLIVRKPEYSYASQPKLEADLLFDYEGMKINYFDNRGGIYDRNQDSYLERDKQVEDEAFAQLTKLGLKAKENSIGREKLQLTPRNLPHVVATLLGSGWRVEAEGKLYRNPGSSNLSVSSGIDWFELHGSLNFGEGLDVKLPALLAALRRGESMVPLGDGSFGLLPQEWLQQYGLFASLGTVEEDHLRFQRTQTGVLDALLAARPEITCDETFSRIRSEWKNFTGVKALNEPTGFVGTLRDYQREGLGWFAFLEKFKFGGCLADDMGLGKTVQVLALLESRRKEKSQPSLVVVPRSLIFNWQQEAHRFTPKLRVLTHAGSERSKQSKHFAHYDLVITTYGTLRRDALHFQEVEFDFVILDEAQAIKNAKTESAKAARLLKSKNRLALSGTPIENHLGELWSLFEFLNPGMLGTSSVFQLSTSGARTPDLETRMLLSRALRPFMLRRTKQEVAKELPEKLEQTIYCEMDDGQRKQYDELRDFYRKSLLEKVSLQGINKSKIQILEALLRLRQTACHPSLVSGDIDDVSPNAKLDILLPRLGEVIDEGHKAIVFSQFTSFLTIVRRRLEQDGVDYQYLDGKTRDREAAVHRFQNDPDCKLFLISLKAGGQGLNLTAAEYVFLLDPWWNPAVEAQAIDRAHRIGQTRRVFAYRLITRDTVEEKVLDLQSTKRDLADAIINADNSVLRNITGEDLMMLLS